MMQKKIGNKNLIRRFLLCFFVIAFLSLCSNSASSAAEQPSSSKEIKVAYFPVQQYYDSRDNASLYVRALFKILSKYINNEISFVAMGNDKNAPLNMLNAGEANVVAFYTKSLERMFQLKYSKNPIAVTNVLIVTNPGKDIDFNDRQALHGKTIAILADNTMGKSQLDEFLIAKNITMRYKIYNNSAEYAKSDADFHLVNSYYFLGNKDIVARIGTQDIYFVALPKNQDLLNKLDYALEQAQKLDAEAMHEIFRKYLDKSSETLDLSAAEKYLLSTRKPYQIGYSSSLFPVQYTDSDGKFKGIAMGVHKLFTQMHHNEDTFTPYEHNSGVDITKFDMVFSIIGDREEKKKHFIESKTYLATPMFVFKPIEESEVENPVLGILDYSVIDHAEIQDKFPHWQLRVFNTFTEMFDAYSNESIQYMLVSESAAEHAFSQLGNKSNKISSANILLPLKFYVSKKHAPTAVNIINAFIDALDAEQVSEVLLEVENAAQAPATPMDFIQQHKMIIFTAVFLLLSLVGGVHFFRLHLVKRNIYELSLVDKLTGLATKEKTLVTMEHMLSKILPGEYMVLCMDIDKFHLLNQVYGKEKSDKVLCLFARSIEEMFGKEHKAESICRLRDDVFLVFCKVIPNLYEYANSERALELELDIKNILHGSYKISLSLGIYIIDDVLLPIETIIDYANVARRAGKSEHGISINLFDEKIKNNLEIQKDIIYKMEHGIENNEFVLDFQPKINLQTDKICGAEVLVRWYPRGGDVIYPDNFIPIFEDNAFIANLDLYVFEKTCQFISKHRDEVNLPPLAVNLSGISIMHPEMQIQMQDIMSFHDIKANELEIEITESAMVTESGDFVDNIRALCDSGMRLSIDDFGTGVSSLYRLSSLCVEAVKLDKAFLDAKFTTKKGIFLVASIISMLRKLGMQVIAEGVETATHVKILKKLHCDVVQGYFYFKPLDEENFLKVLTKTSITKPIS